MSSQNVLVFDNNSYVDSSGGYDAEALNTEAAIATLGHTVTTVNGLGSGALANALAGKTVFVIPELENGNLYAALSSDARNVIKNFVANGGTLILMGDEGSNDINLLNGLFGFNIHNENGSFFTVPTITASADNGIYDVGTHLSENNAVYGISNLPAGSLEIYKDGSATDAALMPYGAGKIAFLAYDWYNAAPRGSQDGGWNALLDAILENATPTVVNHAPTAVADSANVFEDGGAIVIDVLANDTDPDSGDAKQIVSVETSGTTGSVTIVNGKISYDPGAHFQSLNVGETAVDTFTYTMKDAAGLTSTATVQVTIKGTNDGPVAVADTASGSENQILTIDVLANDMDVDHGHSFTLMSGSAPTGQGSVSVLNNRLVFDPGQDFDGLKQGQTATVVLEYMMRDEHGAQSSSTVTLTITGTNDSPTVVHNMLTSALGACDTGAVIGSDDLLSTDPDSSTLTYTIDGSHVGIVLIDGEIAGSGATFTQADVDAGRVALLAGPVLPGSSVATPNGPVSGAGISFSDGFNFVVSDGDGGATPGTFTAHYAAFDTVQTSPQYGGYWGGNGNDYQLGTANGDNMSGGNGCDLMVGGAGNDQMSGGEGNNRLFGQDGNDNLSGGSGNDLLDGGSGDDQIHANGGNNWLFGGSGNDNMSAGDGNDRMWGGDGRDTINANGGNNRIDAGADNDTVTAGNGDDTIILGTGDDVVYANGGANKFQLGGIAGAITDGNDQYTGGSGADKYALYLNDRNGGAAGWGTDTVNGFRLAEGDQLVAFNSKAGFWDDASDLGGLVDSGFVSGSRSADGGDLKLTFGTGAEKSSLILKWFFWDNASFLTSSERASGFGQSLGKGDLIDILQKSIQDGGSVGVSGSDFIAKAHSYISHDFMMV